MLSLHHDYKEAVVGVKDELNITVLWRVVDLDTIVTFCKWPKHRQVIVRRTEGFYDTVLNEANDV